MVKESSNKPLRFWAVKPTPHEHEQWENFLKLTGMTKSELIKKAVNQYIEIHKSDKRIWIR